MSTDRGAVSGGDPPSGRVAELIAEHRREAGMSQLELAARSGVSSKHISFIENGRAYPSRDVLLRLAEALSLTRNQTNALLFAAGYAPAYRELPATLPQSPTLLKAFEVVIQNQVPFPALVLTPAWDIVMANPPFHAMLERVLPDFDASQGSLNLARLILHPDHLRPRMPNWTECARRVYDRVRTQIRFLGPQPDVEALFEEINSYPGVAEVAQTPVRSDDSHLIPMGFQMGDAEVSLVGISGTLGLPPDMSTFQLMIIALFPVDDATDAVFRNLAAEG
jgi:transcriptional regulator with XRE-family HTH domain